MYLNISQIKPAVIGLGYVGLPLAIEISKYFDCLGFDIRAERIKEIQNKNDSTKELTSKQLAAAKRFSCTDKKSLLENCNFFILTVPTPVDASKSPDLTALKQATETASKALSTGNVVVFESTVYPGATEEVCIPILEQGSGLKYNKEFFVGYSPERINPGDKSHTVSTIKKVVSGSDIAVTNLINEFYSTFICAGTYVAPSIKVAEAAKVIENTQRDVNIALINELATLFDKLNIDTYEVLEAAKTKWNFLDFKPGLVGGHCIGVDPYYLTYKAQQMGHHPKIISAGRLVNDEMPKFMAEKLILAMLKRKFDLQRSKIAILGISFKENCPDIRNSKVCEFAKIIQGYGVEADIIDPHVSPSDLYDREELIVRKHLGENYDSIVFAVDHKEFVKLSSSYLRSKMVSNGILFDLKNSLPSGEVDLKL